VGILQDRISEKHFYNNMPRKVLITDRQNAQHDCKGGDYMQLIFSCFKLSCLEGTPARTPLGPKLAVRCPKVVLATLPEQEKCSRNGDSKVIC
jgi:hypothetical protein